MASLIMLAGVKARGQDGPPPDVLTESVLTEVEFRGRVNIGLAEIEARSGLKKGAKVDVFRVGQGVEEIRLLYREKGYPEAEAKLIEGDRPGATRVVIEIIEVPKSLPGLEIPPSEEPDPFPEEKSVFGKIFDPGAKKVEDAFRHARPEKVKNPDAPVISMGKDGTPVLPPGTLILQASDISQGLEDALIHVNRANLAKRAGEYRKALEEMSAAVRLAPGVADFYRCRSEIYSAMFLHRRAIADLTRAIEIFPFGAYFLSRGSIYCLDRDYERGIADIEAVLQSSVIPSQKTSVHEFRGWARKFQGMHDLAVADFDRAIELGLEGSDIYAARGQSLGALGEHERAIADFDRAIAIQPTAFAWFFRGESHFAQGKYALAQDDYERAIELDPKSDAYQQGPGWARLARGQVDGAIEDFTHAIDGEPKKPRAVKGWTISAGPRRDKNTRAFTGRGWAYLVKHDLGRAIADFDHAIEIQGPGRIEADFECRKGVSLIPEYDRAVAEFDERCRSAPNLRFALVILKGQEARSQFLHNPYFAAYLVGRTCASSEIAPNFIFRITADWRSFPDAKSAYVGRAIAAMLRSEWSDAGYYFDCALKSLLGSRNPGSTRPPFSDLLRGE